MSPRTLRIGLVCLLISLMLLGCQEQPAEVAEESVVEAPAGSTPEVPQEATLPAAPPGVTIVADGRLLIREPVVPLSFVVGGRLLTLNVSEGDEVAAGDLLATIDDAALQNTVANAAANLAIAQANLAAAQVSPTEAQIAAAEAQIAVAEAGVASAQAAHDRLFAPLDYASIIEADARVAELELALQGAINVHEQLITNEILGAPEEQAREQVAAAQISLDAARARANQLRAGPTAADIASAEAGISQAEANLASAQANLAQLLTPVAEAQIAVYEAQVAQAELAVAQAEAALSDTQLLAPFAGTVMAVNGIVGLYVSPGSPILSIQDRHNLEFQTSNLSERDLAQIELGMPVQILFKSYPGEPVAGTVVRIGLEADGVVGDSATFPVSVRLEPAEVILRAGMTGRVEIAPP
ncbi:MAG: efflux RND transporter periplasmic adaptor subunit [Anaerolineales bacterium]|nr:efflux RND transporter periplasmic adaptor subunit [Anaerolineales bacterium]